MRCVLLVLLLASCGSNKCKPVSEAAPPVAQQGSAEQPARSEGGTMLNPGGMPNAPPGFYQTGKAPLGQPSSDDLEAPAKPAGNGSSQVEISWKLNQDGIAAMKVGKAADASAKFREAVARVPDSPFFLNLCISLYWEGKFDEALTACTAVRNAIPSASTQAKTDKMIQRIKDEVARQGITLEPKAID